jgi:hypothetical protein
VAARPPRREVLRAGYGEAIRRARTLELPIESLWICADEDPPAFHVYIVEGPRTQSGEESKRRDAEIIARQIRYAP